eukprot:762781-Hanusia_phi.AAC.8
MPANMAQDKGWHIPDSSFQQLMEKADQYEESLYQGEDRNRWLCALTISLQLMSMAKKDLLREYNKLDEASRPSLSEFIAKSKSFAVEFYRDRSENLSTAIDNLGRVLSDCEEKKAEIEKDVELLRGPAGYADGVMHCRRMRKEEVELVDARLKAEVEDRKDGHMRVALPISVSELLEISQAQDDRQELRLLQLVDSGADVFVAVSCLVNEFEIAECMTLICKPCLPEGILSLEQRRGQCLKTLFLADNHLGPFGFEKLMLALRVSEQLQTFHCMKNNVGEMQYIEEDNEPYRDQSFRSLTMLGQALQENRCPLKTLNLSQNHIGPAGIKCLLEGLMANQTVELLDLSSNDLGVAGANHIARCLVSNRKLQRLIVNDARLTQHGLKGILQSLRFNSSLKVLFALENVGYSTRGNLFESLLSANVEEVHIFPNQPWINERSRAAPDTQRDVGRDQIRMSLVAEENFRASFSVEMRLTATEEREQVREEVRSSDRRRLEGIQSIRSNERIENALAQPREHAQGWGPEMKLGVHMPNSAEIVGFNKGKDKGHITCPACGASGHEAFECPTSFYERTGELMPGFAARGKKMEFLWDAAQREPEDEVERMWRELQRKGYFNKTCEEEEMVVSTRKTKDMSKKGVPRKSWSERTMYGSKDSILRRGAFEQSTSQAEFLLSQGSDVLSEFLYTRSLSREFSS